MNVFAEWFDHVQRNVELVIKGKSEVIRLVLIGLFSEGHVLLEDVPGVGKTMLARSVANSIQGVCKRIQFTPDLLPSDVTGVSIFNQESRKFEFHHGPVFANVLLADEINRASPKTQSSLLEVMAERRVTYDGDEYAAPRPFLVIATQNPVESEGIYRLPEAQLDRFLLKTKIDYPDEASEVEILKAHGGGASVIDEIAPVLSSDDAAGLVAVAEGVHVSNGILGYVASIAAATRREPRLRLGVSPRGSIGLVRAARVLAASEGRAFVTAEDIKYLAEPVLAHRVIVTQEAALQGHTGIELIDDSLSAVPVPQTRQ